MFKHSGTFWSLNSNCIFVCSSLCFSQVGFTIPRSAELLRDQALMFLLGVLKADLVLFAQIRTKGWEAELLATLTEVHKYACIAQGTQWGYGPNYPLVTSGQFPAGPAVQQGKKHFFSMWLQLPLSFCTDLQVAEFPAKLLCCTKHDHRTQAMLTDSRCCFISPYFRGLAEIII